jgi:hypothetical protein
MLKTTAIWDVAPFSLVEFNRRFRGAYFLHDQGDHLETSVSFNQTTRRNFQDGSHLYTSRRENQKLYWIIFTIYVMGVQ